MKQVTGLCLICLLVVAAPFGAVAQDPGVITEASAEFLKGFSYGAPIAVTPPFIEFSLVQLTRYGEEFGQWSNVVQGPDGKFYFGLGNHQDGDGRGRSLLVAYDAAQRRDEILMYSIDVLGHREGKWHGRPDINPATGDMYIMGFFVGDLIHYNIYTRDINVIGKPIEGTQLPEHVWDWQRERFYATTQNDDETAKGNLLVYDTRHKRLIYYGRPVDASTSDTLHWDNRTRCLDRETGCLYGTDTISKHIIRYEPFLNSFARMNSRLQGQLRAWTNKKCSDGKFWIFDDLGNMYTFYPEKDSLIYQGKNWGTGCYVSFIENSPSGRYLYYSIAQSGAGSKYGMPIIQFDTVTKQKKAIAFLYEFYKKVCNYKSDKIYGGALNQDGSCLFVTLNGQLGQTRRQSMLYIHIPESERLEGGAQVLGDQYGTSRQDRAILSAVFPNPFNLSTRLTVHLQASEHVQLTIVNSRGGLVQTLVDNRKGAGPHQYVWNGTDGYGVTVSSGIYFAVLQAGVQRCVQKLILMR